MSSTVKTNRKTPERENSTMKTMQIEAYTYTELGQTAKDKVKQWLNEDMQLFDKYTQEMWEEDLLKLGYEECDIQYSGFWSQGDGASIACAVNLETYIKANKLGKRFASLLYWIRATNYNYVHIKRERWGNYVHEKLLYQDTTQMIEELDSYFHYVKEIPEKAYNQLEEIAGIAWCDVVDKSRELYKWLEADYDWHYTDEYMVDMCEANEYLFDEYGDPVHHLEIEEDDNG